MTIYFPNSIVKIDSDGVQSISSTLEPGERLVDGRTYANIAGKPSRAKHAAKAKGDSTKGDTKDAATAQAGA